MRQRVAFVGLVLVVSIAGGGAGPLAEFNPSVVVDSTTTLVTGGSLDWIGRASIKRRADGVLVMIYRRGTVHFVNDGGLYIKFSDDDGATWSTENETLAAVAVDGFPMNPSGAGASEDAGEPWLMVANNGDLVVHMWAIDYGVSMGGTWQWRSTDGGETWTEDGQVAWGIGGVDDDIVFATDDDFVWNGITYAGARIYSGGADGTPSEMILISNASSDLAITSWEKVSTIMGATEGSGSHGGQEVGLEYLGNDTIIAMLRDNDHTASYRRMSTDLGATWGSLIDVTSSAVSIAGRQRVYTRAHLMGLDGWWKDPVLFMTGFEHQDPGSSTTRRNCIWISPDRGITWDGPHFIDTQTEDAGYGDMFYDAANEQYVVVSYDGTNNAADLKQYRLTITGIAR